MKKFLTLIAITICIASCSKNSSNEEQPQQPQQPIEFSATIKDGFTGVYGEEIVPYKNLKNIVVGDEIPYTLTIDETDTDTNVKYVLTAITTVDKNHQTRVDYDFYLENANGEKVRVTEPYIEFHKKGTYKFYIKPLVPGTFKLPFILQKKMLNGEELKKIELPSLNFNVVKIKLKRYLNYFSDKIFINGKSIPSLHYNLKIEDGVNETDIYLSPPGKEWNNTFIVRCNRFKYEGNFEEGKDLSFKDTEERDAYHLASVTIVQRKEGQEEFRVTYYNIPIEKSDRFLE